MSSMSGLPLPLSPLPGDDPKKDLREGEKSDPFLKLLDFGDAPGGGGDRLKCGEEWLGIIGKGATCFLTRIGLPGVDTAKGMLGTGTAGESCGCCCDSGDGCRGGVSLLRFPKPFGWACCDEGSSLLPF